MLECDELKYAILGDIHSAKEDLEKVLANITEIAPEAIKIGLGDLFECTISKRNIPNEKFTSLAEVMLIPKGFTELLTFESVQGNQEERILMITETEDPLREKIKMLPETIELGHAQVIHGHQWAWGGDPWQLIHADVNQSPVFYGHSHHSELFIDDVRITPEFGVPYDVSGPNVLVNVGAVVKDQEWLLYDVAEQTVCFMKV